MRNTIAAVMGPAVTLVDSAAETAAEVAAHIERLDIARSGVTPPEHSFAVSDAPLRFRDIGQTFIGNVVRDVSYVDVEHLTRAA
jgi:glutamate racemase